MRMRKTRMNRKTAVPSVNPEESPAKAFKSPQTFGKAISKHCQIAQDGKLLL